MYIVDPKPDYGPFVRNVGGQTHQIGSDSPIPPIKPRLGRYIFDSDAVLKDRINEVLDHLHHQTGQEDTRNIVVLDEAHRLKYTERGYEALERIVREGRSHGTSVEAVTQNAVDLTASDAGKSILRNVDCHMLMFHEDVKASVDDFYQLSANESSTLRELKTADRVDYSEAILRASRRINTKIELRVHPSEANVIRP